LGGGGVDELAGAAEALAEGKEGETALAEPVRGWSSDSELLFLKCAGRHFSIKS
jgi:hypothetical protein